MNDSCFTQRQVSKVVMIENFSNDEFLSMRVVRDTYPVYILATMVRDALLENSDAEVTAPDAVVKECRLKGHWGFAIKDSQAGVDHYVARCALDDDTDSEVPIESNRLQFNKRKNAVENTVENAGFGPFIFFEVEVSKLRDVFISTSESSFCD